MAARLVEFLPSVRVLWSQGEAVWASKGYDVLFRSALGEKFRKVVRLPSGFGRRTFARIQPLRRLLRLGVCSYVQLEGDEFVAFSDGRIYWRRQGSDTLTEVGSVRLGRGPLLAGCCRDSGGFVYYGEYSSNRARREPVHILRWRPGAAEWEVFYSFPPGSARHVHSVQHDPVSDRVWVTTGDWDDECHIGYFEAGQASGPRFESVANGSQMARAVSLIFTPHHVYWGSDAGRGTSVTSNSIFRWSRQEKKIERLAEIGGPVYSSTVDAEGRLFMATAVEGAISERERWASVWMSRNGGEWFELARARKDIYPLIFGYAILTFPRGSQPARHVYVTANGVAGDPGSWVLQVEDDQVSSPPMELSGWRPPLRFGAGKRSGGR